MTEATYGSSGAITPILITGATGFIGANFVYQFAQQGHQVIAYDLNPPIPLLTE